MDGRSLLGTVLSLIFIFLTLQAPRGGISLGWWGNTVHMKSMPRFFLIDLFVVTDLVFFFKRRIGIGHLGNRYRRVGFLVDFDIYIYILSFGYENGGSFLSGFFCVVYIYIYISV